MSKIDQYLLHLKSRIGQPSPEGMVVAAFFVLVGGTVFGLEWMGWWPNWLHVNM